LNRYPRSLNSNLQKSRPPNSCKAKGPAVDKGSAGGTNNFRTQESNYNGTTQGLLANQLHLKMTARHGTAGPNIDFALRSLQITCLPP
jgi:hypothetical protein